MKNFILQKNQNTRYRWLLLHLNSPSNNEVIYKPFSEFVYWMQNKKCLSINTIDQYAGHVARFLDFTYEAASVLKEPDFDYLLEVYENFLIFGKKSTNREVVELAERLKKSKPTSVNSIAHGIEKSINKFIFFQVMNSKDITSENIFHKYYSETYKHSNKQKKALKEKSILGGCIKSSLNRSHAKSKESLFPLAKSQSINTSALNSIQSEKSFPLSEAINFLTQPKLKKKKSTFVRDMCLFSLLASSGIRISEGLQLQISDIDTINKEVYIRKAHSNLNGLTESELTQLVWKGRETELTFLIEPFASIFWSYLEEYIKHDYVTSVNHDFLFQKKNGRPLFASGRKGKLDRSNINKEFRNYLISSDIQTTKPLSPHSLRHMYGTYILNYIPLENGDTYGMPMVYVQQLMGHKSIESTKKYAIHDTKVFQMQIESANKFIKNNKLDLCDLQKLYIDNQIKNLEERKRNINV